MPLDEVGIFDLRQWECNLPESEDTTGTVTEALKSIDCALTTENADTMARAAAGLLHDHSHLQLSRDPKRKEVPDDNWHRGMLDFLDQHCLW